MVLEISKYYDTIQHHHLRAFLDRQVTDGVIRRMIDKWLKAGVLEHGLLQRATEGTPQGGVVSPLLANRDLASMSAEGGRRQGRCDKGGASMTRENVVPPALMLRQLAFVMRASRALYAAAELNIADFLASGPLTTAELAAAVGADAAALRRLMRALVAHGVFEEEIGDRFRLNAAGELMRRDVPGSQRAAVLFTAGDMQWRLWSDFLECVRTGRAVVERVFGNTIFERNAQNPDEAELFSQAMASFSAALSAPLMAAYDFGSFRRIADIGGGTGRLLADLLAAHRNARGVLFDLPNVVTGALAILAASGVEARCEILGGSFFDGVPPGADAYVLRAILHDWDDDRAITILVNCRKAMTDDGILLIVERVLPEEAVPGRAADSYLIDLEMLVNAPGGRERTEAEFRAIVTAAGFGAIRVLPTTTATSIVEARPA